MRADTNEWYVSNAHVLSWWRKIRDSVELPEKTCVPISLQGVVGIDGESGCTEGQVLSTITNNTCEVKCKETHSWDSGHTTSICGIDGGSAYSSISCSENHCNLFNLGTGMIGDDNVTGVMPCYDGVVLSAESQNTCAVTCSGFTANEDHSGIVSCSVDGGDLSQVFIALKTSANRMHSPWGHVDE